jgi:hypothetical protein
VRGARNIGDLRRLRNPTAGVQRRGTTVSTLTTSQRVQSGTEGYLVVEHVVDPERDFVPVIAEYSELLDSLARGLHAAGRITSMSDDLIVGK